MGFPSPCPPFSQRRSAAGCWLLLQQRPLSVGPAIRPATTKVNIETEQRIVSLVSTLAYSPLRRHRRPHHWRLSSANPKLLLYRIVSYRTSFIQFIYRLTSSLSFSFSSFCLYPSLHFPLFVWLSCVHSLSGCSVFADRFTQWWYAHQCSEEEEEFLGALPTLIVVHIFLSTRASSTGSSWKSCLSWRFLCFGSLSLSLPLSIIVAATKSIRFESNREESNLVYANKQLVFSSVCLMSSF